MEWKKNNTFGTTAFTSYGAFWLSLVALLVLPKLGWVAATTPQALAAYLAVWGVMTGVLFIGTLRMSRALQVVFLSLTVLFFLLAVGDYWEIDLRPIGHASPSGGVPDGQQGGFFARIEAGGQKPVVG